VSIYTCPQNVSRGGVTPYPRTILARLKLSITGGYRFDL
jgi:hypothetical protein